MLHGVLFAREFCDESQGQTITVYYVNKFLRTDVLAASKKCVCACLPGVSPHWSVLTYVSVHSPCSLKTRPDTPPIHLFTHQSFLDITFHPPLLGTHDRSRPPLPRLASKRSQHLRLFPRSTPARSV